MLIVESILITLLAIAYGLFLMGFDRKITARVQKRYGPPIWQQYIDTIKLFAKSTISHGFIFDMGVIMALGGTIATLLFMPVGDWKVLSMSGDLFVVIYLLAVALLGMAMSAVNSANPNASIGIMRALTQMLGYEIPWLVVLVGMMYTFKTSSIWNLVGGQAGGFSNWNMVRMPLGAIVAFTTLMGQLGKKPFDTFIAPAEIASGPMVEYGGKYMGMLIVQHAVGMFVEIGLFVNLFLGGGANIGIFLLKVLAVYFVQVLVGNVLSRFRVEQVVRFHWKWPMVLAFVQSIWIMVVGVR
ncbi:MAG TPA: NADH-quinone oxidoreductase subunit H [Thermotogota bacterium]|nr:NADH-quinone oxidoreductase subunit H [Thermotogota bacterium]HRW93440.1 NADH-quinone oxidoreductase subunit H [Thermotogota bacterium]